MEFQDGNTERLDALRQGGEEGQLKVSIHGNRICSIQYSNQRC